jgi:hypothetical protein
MKEINELDVGTLVESHYDYDSFAIVEECIHGNKYYAYGGKKKDFLEYIEVYDMEDHQLDCCH